ncbi:UDP-4-amino-4,6-dideoxy-N-acetyl-beta-L-altrosamine transaminase [Candidatus Termititenax persephonae]|uniref:UDP-4-amino-4, 6-dideoxy-N-acetyl-beta-L-altrosamine transaminase n=1 Tax=Candidatus Termititenax persephonae TaxID=2218525 RepID=A0A388TGL8_9BACT|nr:UDP-4-amino-4,6-dideoxy-N-acetyl-beta-L-altrosamine transaminase [Candidatus Termititenax persephonae]
MRDTFLVFGSPRLEDDDIQAVTEVLKSGWLGTGPQVKQFETDFQNYIGSRHAMALNSCTAGLHLSMVVLGLEAGDEVITTPLTFCATANSIIHAGGRPVFVDIDRETLNIDADKIEAAITPRTKAILPVHFAGRPCAMDKIMAIAARHKLTVIEDCAHAIEAEYHGRHVGTFGTLGCFSFYVTKNVVTGEGGMVTTDNEAYADKIKMYGLHGMSRDAWKRFSDEGFKHYQVMFPGFKYNMMDIQAALGIQQLQKVEKFYRRRQEIWDAYNQRLSGLPLFLPAPFEPETKHALHLYTVLLDTDRVKITRDALLNALIKENIGTGVHYTALHLHPYYRESFGYQEGDFPQAEYVAERVLSLPLSAKLTAQDVDDVVKALEKILG